MCVKAEELIINLVDSLPFKRFPAQQGGVVGGCHRCVGVSKFFSERFFSCFFLFFNLGDSKIENSKVEISSEFSFISNRIPQISESRRMLRMLLVAPPEGSVVICV